jgi:pilus assembly protein Flp/PilA
MRRLLQDFVKDQSGATAIEYALIAMGLSIVIVASVNGVGPSAASSASSRPR